MSLPLAFLSPFLTLYLSSLLLPSLYVLQLSHCSLVSPREEPTVAGLVDKVMEPQALMKVCNGGLWLGMDCMLG